MKNILKYTLTVIVLFILGIATSCDNEAIDMKTDDLSVEMTDSESAEFLKQNISIFDARIRSINQDVYVRELFLANFSNKPWDKTSIGFDGHLYEDNGKGNDIEPNDGIYSSVEIFIHDEKVPYIKDEEIRSVLETPIVSHDFIQKQALEEFSLGYDLNRKENAKGPVATLECDVEICSTGCIADWIWDGFGCICVSNCRAKIGWE